MQSTPRRPAFNIHGDGKYNQYCRLVAGQYPAPGSQGDESKYSLGRGMKHQDLADTLLAQLTYLGVEGWERDIKLEAGFTPTGRKRVLKVDLANMALKLACEVDGGIWVNGGHNRGRQIELDCLKSQKLFEAGYWFCRFTAKDVKNGNAASLIMGVTKRERASRRS